MATRFPMIVALLLSVAMPALSAPPPSETQIALRELAADMDNAWTAGDVDANAELFAEDATGRFGEDPLGEGREAIRAQFREFFTGRPAGLRHVTYIERIDSLTSELAQWDAEVRVERQGADGQWTALSRIRSVVLARHTADGWRVRMVRAFPL